MRYQAKASVRGRQFGRTLLSVESLEDRCTPATLTVGPGAGYMYALPSQAAAAAHDGDTVQIAAGGNYNGDTCVWTQNNLTIEGVGGRALIDDSGVRVYGQKGIWVIDGNSTTVENVEFSGAHDFQNSGSNWAGIRLEGSTLTLVNDYFHNNDDGILVNAGATSDVTVTSCEFAFNGFGDGQSHNMYIGQVRTFTLQDSYSHDANVGHLVKSRALTNYILYNRIEDGGATTSTGSYEIDLPQGGTSYLIGNVIEQGPYSQNGTIINYGEEGTQNPGQQLYLVNNTVVNDRGAGTFVAAPKSTPQVTLENNIFAGPGTVLSTAGTVTQITNLASSNPGFVNQAGYDYHLTAGSPAIKAGTVPGTANGVNLAPQFEYVDPLSQRPRDPASLQDIGAYGYTASAVNQPPTVATPAAPSATLVTGKTVGLSVLGADDGGEANLTYTWSVVSGPAGVTFSDNGSNAGKNSTATFTQPGSYVFQATIADAGGLSVSSTTQTVTVQQTLTTLAVTPAAASLSSGSTQQFTASGTDQFGANFSPTGLSWSVVGVGSIASGGLYTASGSGVAKVQVASAGLTATASVKVSLAIDAGGAAAGTYLADYGFSGGSTRKITSQIDTSGVTSSAPQAVYQSQRTGNFTYTLANLTPGASYTVRLDFAELQYSRVGRRVFNVAINGGTVLQNFDIVAASGGIRKAVARQFTATADSSGKLTIQFTSVNNGAAVNGIVVSPA